MHPFLTKGLTHTASLWFDVEQGNAWVHHVAHILSNDEKLSAAQVQHHYEQLLAEMKGAPGSSETLTTMLRSELNQRQEARRMQHRFRKAPESYLMALEEKLIKEKLPT